MVRIFLAYAKEDKAKVFELYDRLKRRGYIPWLDKKDLLAGQPWRAEIPKAIRNSDIFIACLSKQSVAKESYIQREFRMALQKMGDMPPGKIYLVPVRLDDCEIPELRQEEYGINLTDYQWVDLFEPDGFEQLVRSIDHHFPESGDETDTVIVEADASPLLAVKPLFASYKTIPDLDNIWTKVLEAIQPMGTKALMRQHAQLIGYDGLRAVVHITNEKLMRLATDRLKNLETAFEEVAGNDVEVRLTVMRGVLPELHSSIPSLQDTWTKVVEVMRPMGTQSLMRQHGKLIDFDALEAVVFISNKKLMRMAADRLQNVERAFEEVVGNDVRVKFVALENLGI